MPRIITLANREATMFDEIRAELVRLDAKDVQLQSDERLHRPKSSLIKLTIHSRSCSVVAAGLLEMLKSLPDRAGITAIEESLEFRSSHAEAWAID
jgi:hypothetical protein